MTFSGPVTGPSFGPQQAEAFAALLQRAVRDQRLTGTARSVLVLVWGWLGREARPLPHDVYEVADALGLSAASVYRALTLLVRCEYVAEGERVRRERTFRRVPL